MSEFSTWLYRITTNVCLSHKEKRQRARMVSIDHREFGDEDETEVSLISDTKTDSRARGNEVSERIEKALEQLSPRQKIVFTLRHFQDYKLKDIAVMMDCAEGTVKKYLFEATQKMRTHLQDLYE